MKELGIKYVYIPMRGTAENPYGPKELDTFAAAMASADGKVLLHCTIAWRASHLWAAYLIRERKMPVDDGAVAGADDQPDGQHADGLAISSRSRGFSGASFRRWGIRSDRDQAARAAGTRSSLRARHGGVAAIRGRRALTLIPCGDRRSRPAAV